MSPSACDRCHRRKSRCDKALPSCGPCRKAGVAAACKYVNHTRDRQKQLQRLQLRIEQLEGENRALSQQLEGRATASDGVAHRPSGPSEADPRPAEHDAVSNELTEEISFLSSRAGGENQFLGSTSGVLLASLVDATVKAPSQGWTRRPNRVVASPLSTTTPASTFNTSPLPDERVARVLHHAYFDHDHVSYPFLHRPTALANVDKIYQDPAILSQDAFSYYSFNMVLAIATASVYKFDRESLPDAETYHSRATERLNELLQRGDTQALQAMLLLCQYRMVNSVQDTSTSMWHLVGVAARMALELGLHREQVYQAKCTGSNASAGLIANEIRRRCFWCVIAMDRIVSITLGRPLAIRLQDTDVALPDPSLDSLVDSNGPVGLCTTALFVHIVRYRIICGDIMSALHAGSTRTQTDAESALQARDDLATTLVQWHHDTAGLSLLGEDGSRTEIPHQSSFRTREWYEMLYCNALLMLYRPSPALSGVARRDSTALQNIFVAAKQAIAIYSQLHRWKRINYTWITLHAVFMAGLSYVYAVGRHFRSHKRKQGSAPAASLESDPAIMDIVNDCRTCSNVLVAISERWNMAKNCYDVFNRLSDAVLVDAVEYHTKATGPQQSTVRNTIPLAGQTTNINWDNGLTPGPLAVDSVLRECLDDLQHFQPSAYGDDPVGQLSQDWMGEIEGMRLSLFLYDTQDAQL
ncbi:fungal-specific transcription factor domain-containing protein [Aspergillus aurantiobrunneus]